MRDFGFFETDACDLDAFVRLTGRTLDPAHVPHADRIEANVPVYDMDRLRPALADPALRPALLAEWAEVFGGTAGVIVLERAYADTGPIDAATGIYEAIIAEEAGTGGADHFAQAGHNVRIWNSLQKLCLRAPQVFAGYFGNTALAAASEAWLGPAYQMTAQVNLVRPGAAAQVVHRDYHLGFQVEEVARRFPAHVHDLSAALTLQGAVAHCDMPVESGPTRLLPFSQLYRPGYLAYRREDFRAHFDAHFVQLPLKKGDAVFFNPALFHAAGDNRSSDIQRMANLLQVSSAFGRALENIDRTAMVKALYPALQAMRSSGEIGEDEATAAIGAAAEGYSFPTNLDTDPPVGGLAPETQAALFQRALAEGMPPDAFAAEVEGLSARKQP